MATIMDCPSCGRKLRVTDDAPALSFQCPTCGHSFAPPAPEPTETRPCRFCGEDIRRDAIVCRHCGEDLNDARPPWERPGGVRFDWEPHRGDRVFGLGVAGLVGCMVPCVLWVGVPLALAAVFMGTRDLRLMDTREMDPRGRPSTVRGLRCGGIGLLFACVWLLYFGGVLWSSLAL